MTTELKDKYLRILAMFTFQNEDLITKKAGKFMLNPFAIKDKVFATDTIAMVFFDKTLAPDIEELKDYKPENVLKIIPAELNENTVIKTTDFNEALDNCPVVDDYDEVDIHVICPTCKGDNNKCDDCDNQRTIIQSVKAPNGNVRLSEDTHFRIRQSVFTSVMANRILEVAKILEAEEIILVSQTAPYAYSLFKIGEASLLVAPEGALTEKEIIIDIV